MLNLSNPPVNLLWVQLHGSHSPKGYLKWRTPESEFYERQRPFVAGMHNLNDQRRLEWMVTHREAYRLDPSSAPPPPPARAYTTQLRAPVSGPYLHLSWAYFNKERFSVIQPLLASILRQDPAVRLLLCAMHGYPDFNETLRWLREEHPSRFVSVFELINLDVWDSDDRGTPTYEREALLLADRVFVCNEEQERDPRFHVAWPSLHDWLVGQRNFEYGHLGSWSAVLNLASWAQERDPGPRVPLKL